MNSNLRFYINPYLRVPGIFISLFGFLLILINIFKSISISALVGLIIGLLFLVLLFICLNSYLEIDNKNFSIKLFKKKSVLLNRIIIDKKKIQGKQILFIKNGKHNFINSNTLGIYFNSGYLIDLLINNGNNNYINSNFENEKIKSEYKVKIIISVLSFLLDVVLFVISYRLLDKYTRDYSFVKILLLIQPFIFYFIFLFLFNKVFKKAKK